MQRAMRLLGILVVLALATTLAACGSDSKDSTSASSTTAGGDAGKQPIVVGWTKAGSGFMSFYDTPVSIGGQFAVDDINARGGVLGRPLKIVYADYKTDVKLVEAAAKQLLDQNVDFIHTACDYDFAGPAARLANTRRIVNLGCAGSTLFGLEGLGPYSFNTWHGNPTEAAVIGDFIAKQGWKHPYMLQDTGFQYTKEVCQLAEKRLAEAGVTFAGKDTYKNDDSSFSAQVSKLRDDKQADAVLVCGVAPGGPALIKQIRDAGIKLPIVGSAGGLDGTFWQKAVPNIDNYYAAGAVYSIYGDDPNPKLNALTRRFEQKTGAPPAIGHVAAGYVAIESLAKAIEKAGSTDADKVKAALESFSDEPLIVGPTTYTPQCHVPYGRPLAVIEFTDGKPRHLETIKPENVPQAGC